MVFVGLAAGLTLAGCGSGDGTDVTGPPATPTSSPSTTATPSTTGAPSAPSTGALPPGASVPPGGPKLPPGGPKLPPGGPKLPPGVGATELTGTIESGVEPGCLLLDGHQLVGGPKDVLVVGARVSIIGRARPDLMSTCQQGVPFVVESARRS
ncbi:hypothetical protein OHQ87_20290 [Micromonospora sp. NBC_00421]